MIFDNYLKNNKIQFVSGISSSVPEALNVQQVLNIMNSEPTELLPEEAIITPYYIDNGKTYELYQYEFSLLDEGFLEFLERKTGKKPELVDRNILKLRGMCFANLQDGVEVAHKNIRNYFDFLLSNQEVQQEIATIFGTYEKEKMFIAVY